MKRNNINKNDILENIKHHHGLPISFSEKIFNFIFDIILEGLERDGRLKIAGFGTFKILNKKRYLLPENHIWPVWGLRS